MNENNIVTGSLKPIQQKNTISSHIDKVIS